MSVPTCAVAGVLIVGISRRAAVWIGLVLVCGIAFVWVAGVLYGSTRCGTGFEHVDALVSYVRLHVIHRRAALELSSVLEYIGVPLRLTGPEEFAGLVSATGMVMIGAAGAVRHSRRALTNLPRLPPTTVLVH